MGKYDWYDEKLAYDYGYTYSDYVRQLEESLSEDEYDYLCGLSDEELEEAGL